MIEPCTTNGRAHYNVDHRELRSLSCPRNRWINEWSPLIEFQ